MRYGWLALAALLAVSHADSYENSPGETYPDAVEMPVGGSVNISCSINPMVPLGLSAANMQFFDQRTGIPVPQEHIDIVNATTIVYKLRNAPAQDTVYHCKINSLVIAYTKVKVGTPPTPVDELSCRGYDFEYQECKFKLPANAVPTQSNLSYTVPFAPSYKYYPDCKYDKKPLVECNTTRNQHQSQFIYQLTLTNTLGSLQQNFTVNNFVEMELARPAVRFRVKRISTDSVQVAWDMPKWDIYRLRGLEWEVVLQPEFFPPLNLSSNVTVERRGKEVQLSIDKLPFAYYWYDLLLRVRLSGSARWSKASINRFRTAPRLPDRGPRITDGSFYLDDSEMRIRLYWEEFPLHERNGANFSYRVTDVRINGTRQRKTNFVYDLYSAIYFLWDRDSKYEFAISTSNHLGNSSSASHITIMPVNQSAMKTHAPRVIHSVYHGTNRSYTLTWKAPEETSGLRDYTVYWCHSKTAVQNECNGSLHFKTLPLGTHIFNTEPQTIESEHALSLAVSANYDGFNTGMHWTSCTGDLNSSFMKMAPEVKANTATTISVRWIANICPVLLTGYNLTYCEVAPDAHFVKCLSELRSVTIDQNMLQYDITDLQPHTVYRVQMVMYNGQRAGKPSDSVLVRTKEAAPSAPLQLHVTRLTNTSATMKWQPPSQMNGKLKFYELVLNNEHRRVYADQKDLAAGMVYVCGNLTSFTRYKAYVMAHTVENSPRSNDVDFTTLIGSPTKPSSGSFVSAPDNKVIIKWTDPAQLNGRLDFWEVRVTHSNNGTILQRRISTIVGSKTQSCLLKVPDCLDNKYETTVDVRAVNAAVRTHEINEEEEDPALNPEELAHYVGSEELLCENENQHQSSSQRYYNATTYRLFRSEWQPVYIRGCPASHLSTIMLYFLLVGTATITLVACFIFGRQKYKRMANIHCTLPSGLAYITKEGFGGSFMQSNGATDEKARKDYVYHNEKHHLLKEEEPHFRLRHSESSFDSAPHSEDSEHIELLDDSGRSQQLAYVNTETAASGYVKAPDSDYKQKVEMSSAPSSGYVSVENVQPAIPQSGYVAVGLLQNPQNRDSSRFPALSSSGYTTLDTLKSEVCAPHNAGTISGYVTQGELTAFGQFQQRN